MAGGMLAVAAVALAAAVLGNPFASTTPASAPAPPAVHRLVPATSLAAPAAPPPPVERASTPAPATDVYAGATSTRLSPAVAGLPERVYVPDTGSNQVDVIDPKTFKVVGHFPVGRLPHHITPSWDLRHLYVNDTYGDALTEIDPRSGRPRRTIPVTDPYNLYFTPDGRRAIVVAERFSRLDFRDPHSWRLIRSVSVPYAGVDHLDFSADGRFLMVSTEFSGMVVKVDVRRMKVVETVRVGGLPVDVKLSPDGSVFYVANQGRGGVSVVDANRRREVGFLPTGAGAHGLYVSRDARSLYVSNRMGGSISVIDLATRRVRATWRVGASPDMIQISPNGRQLWVSDRYNGSVSVVDTRSGRLIRRIPVGPGPHGLSYFPEPGRFSVGHNGVYR